MKGEKQTAELIVLGANLWIYSSREEPITRRLKEPWKTQVSQFYKDKKNNEVSAGNCKDVIKKNIPIIQSCG